MQREPRQREKAAGARRLLDQELDAGRAKMTPDRIEREHDDFFERVRSTFLARATAEPRRFRVIDATPAAHVVAAESVMRLREYMNTHG